MNKKYYYLLLLCIYVLINIGQMLATKHYSKQQAAQIKLAQKQWKVGAENALRKILHEYNDTILAHYYLIPKPTFK